MHTKVNTNIPQSWYIEFINMADIKTYSRGQVWILTFLPVPNHRIRAKYFSSKYWFLICWDGNHPSSHPTLGYWVPSVRWQPSFSLPNPRVWVTLSEVATILLLTQPKGTGYPQWGGCHLPTLLLTQLSGMSYPHWGGNHPSPYPTLGYWLPSVRWQPSFCSPNLQVLVTLSVVTTMLLLTQHSGMGYPQWGDNHPSPYPTLRYGIPSVRWQPSFS